MIIVHELLGLYVWVLIAAALMSWVPAGSGGLESLRRVLATLTEPVLRPLRAILPRPRIGAVGLDLSVLVAIILVQAINVYI